MGNGECCFKKVSGNLDEGGKKLRFHVVDELRDQFNVKELCKFLGVSESGYYKYKKYIKLEKDAELKQLILKLYEDSNKQWGYRRIHMELQEEYQMKINHKRVYRLCRELGIQSIIRKKQKSSNYNQYKRTEPETIAPNIINRDFSADKPNEKWVTDITSFPVGEEKLHLSAILDLYNNEIIAYEMARNTETIFVIKTVSQAIQKEKDVQGVILHSDRGAQYTSKLYQDTLESYNIRSSMSRPGNPFDNACIESFFSHLKTEAFHPYSVQNLEELEAKIHQYIHHYNHTRRQKRLNRQSPVNYRSQQLAA
ncbi:IS3 family transposase [Metabacillus arenae]|uniref:IS3 family transposase n=1 Tax=Metabacillus arenae TaxID=2771434 RepID=A0A926NTG9_9BACI|nr:IS3 family transposase [Metabacillus arenae]MBD1383637.1 IS3 family transposase [Metabacillus arenae]